MKPGREVAIVSGGCRSGPRKTNGPAADATTKVHREIDWVQSDSRVPRSAMPRATSPASPDLAGVSILDEEDDDDQDPIGAVASIQAAAKKGTRPH